MEGKEIEMPRKLMLLAATLPLMLSAPALAQTATDQAPAGGVEAPPPPAATDTAPPADITAPDATAPDESAATEPLESTAPADTAAGGTEILTEESEDQVLAAKIIGMDVVNSAGEEIGKVDDVLLDKSGAISGLVLKSGGVLGMGGKTVAIAWQDVAAAEQAEAVTVDLTAEQIDAAPEFRTKEDAAAEALMNASPPAAPAGPATPTPE